MSDMIDYKDLLGRYMAASTDFIDNIPDEVIEESDGAFEALSEMTEIAFEILLLKLREL